MIGASVNNDCEIIRYRGAMETMGERIRRLREARHLSQTKLAKKCGVTPQAVSRWEAGLSANIQLDTFLCLLKVLDTDAEYLVWGPTRSPSDRRLRNNSD